jgi:hypothetical protein
VYLEPVSYRYDVYLEPVFLEFSLEFCHLWSIRV